MDDQAKKQQIPQSQTAAPDAQKQPTQVPSVGTGNKEAGVYVDKISEKAVLHPEVQPFIEHSEPEVPSHEHVAPAADSAEVNLNPTSTVLPMSDKQIEEALKEGEGNEINLRNLTNRDEETKNVYSISSKFGLAVLIGKIKKVKEFFGSRLKQSPNPV